MSITIYTYILKITSIIIIIERYRGLLSFKDTNNK